MLRIVWAAVRDKSSLFNFAFNLISEADEAGFLGCNNQAKPSMSGSILRNSIRGLNEWT
jgi:hypothetical protein